jgi:hypothetical protein
MDYKALTDKLLSAEQPHSGPFKEGMAAVLRNRVDDIPVTSPYPFGSTEDDAFFAGRMRAHNEFRNLLAEHNGDRDAAIAQLRNLAAAARRAA